MVALPLLVLWGVSKPIRAVAQPANKYWSEENGCKGRSFAAALGVAHMAFVPGIQHARRKLADT